MASILRHSDHELRRAADDFLLRHHPGLAIPVPIERIVEKNLGLEIVPFRAYRSRFGLDGAISSDLTTITVDEHCMEEYPNRYRFTLAHEVAHLVLHAAHIRDLAADTPNEWQASVLNADSIDRSRMEYQAHFFAGSILVPKSPLLSAYDDARRQIEARGYDIAELSDVAISEIAGSIAKLFHVSTQVVERRLKKEGLTSDF